MTTPARVVDLDRLNRHLANLDHLDRFGGRFLFPLSRIYQVDRECVVSILNDLGGIRTDRDDNELFAAAAQHRPELGPNRVNQGDLAALLALKPFHDTTGRVPTRSLPFDPNGDGAIVRVARVRNSATRLLGTAIEVRVKTKQ